MHHFFFCFRAKPFDFEIIEASNTLILFFFYIFLWRGGDSIEEELDWLPDIYDDFNLFEDCYALKWLADFDLGFFKKLTFVPNRDKVKAFELLENINIDFFGFMFDVLT
jgi:hypothetical protein